MDLGGVSWGNREKQNKCPIGNAEEVRNRINDVRPTMLTTCQRPVIRTNCESCNMRTVLESRSMRTDSYLTGRQPKPVAEGRSRSMIRIIGIMTIVLLAGGSAFGQFIVQPMKVETSVHAGRRVTTKLAVENLSEDTAEIVDLRLVDMSQDPSGVWQSIEPDASVTEDPNGARWVTVGTEQDPLQIDVSKLRSCQKWLRLETDVIELDPLQRKEIGLQIRVPGGTRGYYCAALLAQTRFRPTEGGVHASVILQFLIPVIIEVQGPVMRHDIKVTGIDLEYRPQQELRQAATLVTLGVANTGGTYNRLVGKARVWGQMGGHWRKITDTDFIDTGIIPGVTLNLKEDVGRPLPSGTYRITGVLYVDGRRSQTVQEVIEYDGDKRIVDVPTDAAMDLDPGELTIETMPGAVRGKPMKVINASDENVIVDVELAMPDEMRHAAIVDARGRTVRGDQMGCVEWLDVVPRQFTLQGHTSRNLRVTARMPKSENPFPNYYAAVRFKARYPDGQTAGSTVGRVYVTTRGVESEPRILGKLLTLGESAPGRYFVTAHFSNSGNSHVLPRCRAALTMMPSRMLRKRIDLSGEAYEKGGGSMLPCETRKFSGVLDVGDILPGTYRLTAILEYGVGLSQQVQKSIEVTEQNGQKKVVLKELRPDEVIVIEL